jgi:hypothetical protein
MDLKTHIALELHCEKHTKRRLKVSETYSKQMQDELEPIEEPLYSKSNLYDKIGVPASGSCNSHLPRLIKEIEDRATRNNKGDKDADIS